MGGFSIITNNSRLLVYTYYDLQVRSKLHSNKRVSLEMGVKGETDDNDINYIRLDGTYKTQVTQCVLYANPVMIDEEDSRDEGESGACSYHTVILDCAPIVFIDSTGIAVLEQVSFLVILKSIFDFT